MRKHEGNSISLLDSIRLAKKQLKPSGSDKGRKKQHINRSKPDTRGLSEPTASTCSILSTSSRVAEQDKSVAASSRCDPAGTSCQDSQQTSRVCVQETSLAPQQVPRDDGSRNVNQEAAAHHSSECAADRPQQAHPVGSLEAPRCPIQACTPQPEASISVPATAGRQSRAPAGFYGQSWRLRDVELHVLRLLKAVRLKLEGAVSHPFQHFPLQEPAFRWADAHELAAQLRVFSVEKDETSRRSFIVTTYAEFWRQYQDMSPNHRHYYEIIREGFPCHLYFDLEFKTEFNQEVDGEALADLVVKLAGALLQEKYELSLHPSCVIELDSSTAAKFSRHLILRLPAVAFCNNKHVGALVMEMLTRLPSQGAEGGNEYAALWVTKDADGNKMPFIDKGVYSRNRAFRLMLSSKAGRQSWLLTTGRLAPVVSQKATFFDALICNVPPEARLLTAFEGDSQPPAYRTGLTRGAVPHMGPAAAQMGPCPYPDIEAFITSVCSQGGVQGRVRSWMHWLDLRLLLLNMRDNRFCANVGRPHKSNGIFYVVDLQEAVWYQKCYDPDCHNYRSTIMPLPPPIVRQLHTRCAGNAAAGAVGRGMVQCNSSSHGYMNGDANNALQEGVLGNDSWPDEEALLGDLHAWEASLLAQSTIGDCH